MYNESSSNGLKIQEKRHMKPLTFRGGIHPQYCKDISIREPLRIPAAPSVVVIPLTQHIGAPNEPLVKKGDIVEEGQVLGASPAFVSSPVHATVSGKVTDVKKAFHPVLGPTLSVFVERDAEKASLKYENKAEGLPSPEKIREKVRDAGIVGMGGAAFPTHVKLSVPEGKKIDTLIVNGAECEPYLTCDHIAMTRRTSEILAGIEIAASVLKPDNIYIAVEDNKKAAIFAFQKMIRDATRLPVPGIKVVPLRTKYPQGGEKQLISAVTGREVPPGKLPLDIGCLVQNVGTLYAVYEAVYFGKPLIERIVTVSGDCLERPGNYLLRVGTTIKEMVDSYGIELSKTPRKVIMGGPMMGIAQPHTDVPILKSTSGILFLSEEAAAAYEEGPCIKCAKCVDICPVRLIPTEIMKNVKIEKWEAADKQNISDCMECGACTYTCPARIPLVQHIKQGKDALRRKQ